MPAIDFPNSPSINDTHTVGNRIWKWNGATWDVLRSSVPYSTGATGPIGAVGSTGVTGPTGSVYVNVDGGIPSSSYGGITPLDGGGVS